MRYRYIIYFKNDLIEIEVFGAYSSDFNDTQQYLFYKYASESKVYQLKARSLREAEEDLKVLYKISSYF